MSCSRAMAAVVTTLPDELIRGVLGFLPHAHGGKSRFGRTGRRARDVHASTLPAGFVAWVAQLSSKQRRWVAHLTVAPPIRAGFESGEDCRVWSHGVMQAAGQSDDVLGRLMAYQAGLVIEEEDWQEERMFELPVVFVALGFLTTPRIEELLKAKLNRERWSVVFDYRGEDVNTILLDPLFSFAKWGEMPVVTGRYEMIEAVTQWGRALQYASDGLEADRGVVIEAVKQDGGALQYTSDELKRDRGVVIEAVKQWGEALQYASDELKRDRGVVIEAVKQWGGALNYASDELKRDRGVVIEAVKQDGYALEYASAELKADRGVVIEAVKQYGRALQYVSVELKADRSVVIEAVKQYGHALRWASAELKADRGVVIEAVNRMDGHWGMPPLS